MYKKYNEVKVITRLQQKNIDYNMLTSHDDGTIIISVENLDNTAVDEILLEFDNVIFMKI